MTLVNIAAALFIGLVVIGVLWFIGLLLVRVLQETGAIILGLATLFFVVSILTEISSNPALAQVYSHLFANLAIIGLLVLGVTVLVNWLAKKGYRPEPPGP